MIATTRQLAFDLGHRIAVERDAFLVTPSNEEAVGWIDRWPAWPMPALVLEGPTAAGKTHLAEVWRTRAGAGLVEGPSLDAGAVPGLLDAGRPLAVDDAHLAPEQPLLHLYNGIVERGLTLLLVAARPPARWDIGLADLASRLKALPVAAIAAPDDQLIHAVLIKLFADRQLIIADDIVDFLTARMERSFEAASRLVAAIDKASLAARRKVTLPLARDVLQAIYPSGD